MNKKIEIYENDLRQILTALKSCEEHGYVDCDRDWRATFSYDASEVNTAIITIGSLLIQHATT